MTVNQKSSAQLIYLILAALFIASLVTSNLIFQKFFYWEPFGLYRFEISVGILPYPITFLITDILSEIYGKKKANQVVIAGIFASFFSMLIILVADYVPATDNSPIDNQVFSKVFGLSPLAVLASMLAYLAAQFIDIRIFHFWKRKTKGKHCRRLRGLYKRRLRMAINKKDVEAEIKRLESKITGDMYEDMELMQQIYELKVILNPEIENNPEQDDDDCLYCGS